MDSIQQQPKEVPQEIEVLWLTAGLSCDGETVAVTGATQPGLEKAILEISGREQRRIGQDLHDGLEQHLTGIAILAKVQEQRLAEQGLPEAVPARKIAGLVNDAIFKTRELSRGLLPVLGESDELMSALGQWARELGDLFHIKYNFRCPNLVLIEDSAAASHLFYIAQEAVNNAVKQMDEDPR